MLPLARVEVLEYFDASGHSPYARWFDSLNAPAAAKVAIALTRLSQGNFYNARGVGNGIQEYKLDFGPGYRIYFGKDGDRFVILLGAERRSDSNKISIARLPGGWTTRRERNRGRSCR